VSLLEGEHPDFAALCPSHIPGWFFMGVLWENLTQPAGGALSIFLVSLGFGYAAHRSRSVLGGVIAHFLNNLF